MSRFKLSSSHAWASLILWAMLLVAFLYGRALTLPFFFDDFVHLPYVDAYSLADMWRTAGSLAYYRPLSFTLWKLLALALGYNSPFWQHSLNLLLHLINGLLTGWVAGILWSASSGNQTAVALWLRRWLSTTLYLVFPFSYQSVPWAGALSQILVTTLILLSVAGYWQGRSNGRWWLLGLGCAVLAPFAHENGILVGPLVALIAWSNKPRPSLRTLITHGLLWTLPGLLWLPVWWLAPKAISGSVVLNQGEPLWQNSLYFAQGLAFPLTWLGGQLRDGWGWNDVVATATLTLLAILSAIFVQRWRGWSSRSLLPWLWWATAVLPAVLFLRFDYVINGPRLLTAASVGIAWLWADVVLGLVTGSPRNPVWRVALTAAAAYLLFIPSARFIRERMQTHLLLGTAVAQATQATVAASAPVTFINFPSWITPPHTTFALGHEGVLFWPDYAQPADLVRSQTGQPADVVLVRHDATRPQLPYFYGLSGPPLAWKAARDRGGLVFSTDYTQNGIAIRPAGAFLPAASANQPLATFVLVNGNGRLSQLLATPLVTLLAGEAVRQTDGLTIRLSWRLEAALPDDITVFVHVVDGAGQLIAQADGDPLAGSYPLRQWVVGQMMADGRWVSVGDEATMVLVGLYSRTTGERLRAFAAATQQPAADNAIPLPVLPLP